MVMVQNYYFPWKGWANKMHTIESLQKKCHRIAVEHGWWEMEKVEDKLGDEEYIEQEKPISADSLGTKLMLIVCELAEAFEEVRNGNPDFYIQDGKPEGLAVEAADCIIRILDLAGHRGWNMDNIIEMKLKYNETRSHRHGGKLA